MKQVQFTAIAHEQLEEWKKYNRTIYSRIEQLLFSIQENPFKGIGKPEPLKREFGGVLEQTYY